MRLFPSNRPGLRLHRATLALVALAAVAGFWLPAALRSGADQPQAPPQIRFDRDIRPILSRRCFQCHGPQKQESGLRLDLKSKALAGGDSGKAIVPERPDDSELLRRVQSDDDSERMPPKGAPLSAEEIDLLRRWIAAGAAWPEAGANAVPGGSGHWSFQPVRRPAVPRVMDRSRVRGAIDAFVQARLEAEGLSLSDEAERHTLIRRVYLDLIGIAPRPDELAAALADDSPDWYERLVDRLLASPHFGERWGLDWLDTARYADSDGYEKDLPRPYAWHWRDWLIDAVNRDLPFDEFTIEQLAGDRLPGARQDQQVATGFQRNTLTNREGGIDQEEFRQKAVADRVNTTFTAWLGLTVGCAECHSHKYDPISQREYYKLFAFFNDAEESNLRLPLTQAEEDAFFQSLLDHAAKAKQVEDRLDAASAEIRKRQGELERQLLAEHREHRVRTPRKGLVLHLPLDGSPRDTVSGKNVGTYQSLGEVEWAEGRIGRALALHGIGYYDIDTSFRFERDQPLSYGAWVNMQSDGAVITKMDDVNAFRGFDVVIMQRHVLVHLVHRWPEDAIRVATTEKLPEDAWRHLLVTYDGSSKAAGIRIFIDGRLQQQEALVDTLANTIQNDQPLRIGSRSTTGVFRGLIDDVRIYDRVLSEEEVAELAFDDKLLKIVQTPPEDRSAGQRELLLDYLQLRDAEAAPLRKRLSELEHNTPRRPEPAAYVMVERPQPRETRIHLRGDFLKPGDAVEPGTPAFLPPLAPRGVRPDRLDLARWIVDPANPLTARVAANAVWAHLFGFGLVRTADDFGAQGEPPTHPKLLDHLASELVRGGWSRKRLIRAIVASQAYRQSSAVTPALARLDPENRLLARQNRVRLPAELIRDQYLAAAGLLERRIGGPSFRPPLPAGVGAIQFVNQWAADTGAEVYRRGVYVHLQRNLMLPMFAAFDHPDSITACTRRERSNTPLQALTLLNGPTFVDAARRLGLQLAGRSELSDEARIRRAYLAVLSRPPDGYESQRVTELLIRLRGIYERAPEAAASLVAGDNESDKDKDAAPAGNHDNGAANVEQAAWIALCRGLLNLDEAITRE